jgi:drug/metabolite transporter (DMT)-like permease
MRHGFAPVFQGILLMLLGMATFATMAVLIRWVSAEVPTPLMVFLRNAMSLLLMIPWVVHKGPAVLKTERIWRHVWRAGVGITSMELWFYSISIMPVTHATALSFTTPLFVTALALLFLGEKAGMRRWAALLIGFMGVLLITRPGTAGFGYSSLIVLTASTLMAIASILVKTLTSSEPGGRIIFFMALFMTIFSFPLAIPFWKMLTPQQYLGMFLIALTSTISHFCLVKAYTKTEMVVLMPFDFTRLIFTAVMAYFAFGERVDAWSWAGSAVIVTSAAYITWREQKVKKESEMLEEKAVAGPLPV